MKFSIKISNNKNAVSLTRLLNKIYITHIDYVINLYIIISKGSHFVVYMDEIILYLNFTNNNGIIHVTCNMYQIHTYIMVWTIWYGNITYSICVSKLTVLFTVIYLICKSQTVTMNCSSISSQMLIITCYGIIFSHPNKTCGSNL